MDDLAQYHELAFYTLSLRDKEFIHQHIVDAYGAQNANDKTKPIALFFSLAGLYLLVERNYTGRQVQKAHQTMASKTKIFITLNLPEDRGQVSVKNVLDEPAGTKRNMKIMEWCRSVWSTYADQHRKIIEATDKLLF
ncbi:MAG TPA: DUF5946 family protein [Mucilaginibacter sp.]|jgi:hypothetical protein|nr:DUF5946 family protein [Mucilaginibacter sp.]